MKLAEGKAKSDTPLAVRRQITKLFHKQDDSYLWPVCSRFNVTRRAICRIRKVERVCGPFSPLEYALLLEDESSRIVNSEYWE
ncbi:MAG: hypothetical protein GY853_00810 [PVC group bacterium]|nr:hypothetical protein [PVC group bacterium]